MMIRILGQKNCYVVLFVFLLKKKSQYYMRFNIGKTQIQQENKFIYLHKKNTCKFIYLHKRKKNTTLSKKKNTCKYENII